MKFEWKFHFGKKKRTIFDWVKLGAALNFSIEILSLIPGLDRKAVFNAIDAFQLKGDYDFLNEYIINDREFLSFRLERELNRALKEYHGQHK